MTKRKYVKPVLETEEFVPQEYIAACYVDAFGYEGRGAGIIMADVDDVSKDGLVYTHAQLGTCNKHCNPDEYDMDKLPTAYLVYDHNSNQIIDGKMMVQFWNTEKCYKGKTTLNINDFKDGQTNEIPGCFFIEVSNSGGGNKNLS